jgi:hypothetical protein
MWPFGEINKLRSSSRETTSWLNTDGRRLRLKWTAEIKTSALVHSPKARPDSSPRNGPSAGAALVFLPADGKARSLDEFETCVEAAARYFTKQQ